MPTKKQINKLLKERYFLKNETKWEDIVERVSKIYPEIKDLIKEKKFIPSSPTLMNANTNGERIGTLSSCFTMDIKDSIDNIMNSAKEAAIVTKMAGGVGYSWDDIRASSELVKSNGKSSGGPLSFIGIINSVLDGVQQGGARRGAGMAMLNIYHPDILKFINAKKDINKFNRLNFSVRVPDKFYQTLEKTPDKIFKTINVVDGKENVLIDENGKTYTYKKLWDTIIESAWFSAEPGIFNSDIATRQCTVTNVNKTVLSNPCSEFTNIPYASCNLGSIDLSKFVKNSKFEYGKFAEAVETATKFLNSIIDINNFPLEIIDETTKNTRPIGLGYMGLAHALFKLGIPYNSEEGLKFIEDITTNLTLISMKTSIDLAIKEGPYPSYDEKTFLLANKRFNENSYYKNTLVPLIKKYGIRNSSSTSLAPTGCVVKSTNIKTDRGVLSIEDIFKLNGIDDLNKINEDTWFEPIVETNVETTDGLHRILKLYANGLKPIIKLQTEDGQGINATENHKIIVKVDGELYWKRLDEIKIGDEILIEK